MTFDFLLISLSLFLSAVITHFAIINCCHKYVSFSYASFYSHSFVY